MSDSDFAGFMLGMIILVPLALVYCASLCGHGESWWDSKDHEL